MSKKWNITKDELKFKLQEIYKNNNKLTVRLIDKNKDVPTVTFILKFINGQGIEDIYNFINIETPKKQIILSKRHKYTLREVQDIFEKEECKLLSTELTDGVFSIVEYICSCGNKSKIKISDFMNGHRCMKCGTKLNALKRRKSFVEINKLYNENGCKLISSYNDYINGDSKLEFECACGEKDIKSFNGFKLIPHCKNCNKSTSGANHYAWKGGISPINEHLRKCIYEWKLDSFKFNNKCIFTNKTNNNDLHHLFKTFSELSIETFNISNINIRPQVCDYTEEELKILENLIIKLHYDNGYGVTIDNKLHKLLHSEFGYDIHLKEFLDFSDNLIKGKYNQYLKENNIELNINYSYLNKLMKGSNV